MASILDLVLQAAPSIGSLAAGVVAGYQAARRRVLPPPPRPSVTATGTFLAPPDPTVPRVLLIEDDATTGRALRRLLTELGYAVDLAYDRADAERLGRTYAYRAIICDLTLAGADVSEELLEHLRTRRIVYSGAEERRLARVRGMDAVVAKPDAPGLVAALERLAPIDVDDPPAPATSR